MHSFSVEVSSETLTSDLVGKGNIRGDLYKTGGDKSSRDGRICDVCAIRHWYVLLP